MPGKESKAEIRVSPHDAGWAAAYERERAILASCLTGALVRIHHIGSTAIPEIHAKPIIDILVEATGLAAVDASSGRLAEAGYEAMGEYGIPGRRYFRRNDGSGTRTHHVHVFEADSAQVRRHLAFRDYLRAHPTVAGQYSELKQHLARLHAHDANAYMDGKDDFIRRVDAAAAKWRASEP